MTDPSDQTFITAMSGFGNSASLDDAMERDFWMDLYDVIFFKNRDIYYRTLSHIVKNSFAAGGVDRAALLSDTAGFDIVQFWDKRPIPGDVATYMKSWRDHYGSRYKLFDNETAEMFIKTNFDASYLNCFRRCWHPAMKSDFFRLCYIYVKGGCYVDADERMIRPLPNLDLGGDVIMLQPFIRGWSNDRFDTIYLENFLRNYDAHRGSEVYFNNAPLIASKRNPVVELSLLRAKYLIEKDDTRGISIHDVTGPSNLSNSLVIHFLRCGVIGARASRVVAFDWPFYAHTGDEAELSYKSGSGNWRS